MRKKPKFQYTMLKMLPPKAIAPIYIADPRCPAIAISIIPNNGTVMLEIILGNAKRNIFLSIAQKYYLLLC